MPKAQDDDLVMNLVELALSRPADTREAYLHAACAGDTELFTQVWNYVQWDDRMRDFLLEPFFSALPQPRFAPGELLADRFRIVREVAQGGMGIVYEATDERLGRRIALKCAKSGFRKRLSPEVRNASEISHPNVCKIFEIHTASTSSGEIDFLTMEFLDGETLAARLKRGPLPKAEARDIARQICAGLGEAHRNRVVHGDLKTNNVILTQDASGDVRAVITDFGLARRPSAPALDHAGGFAGSEPGSSLPGGTPDYMAPELWKGEKPSAASDVYALGVVLRELAGNQRTPRDPWDSVVRTCLDPAPEKRFLDASEVAVALEPSRAWKWWLAAAAAVALAAGVGAITYEGATAPQESIRLALLPLEAGPGASAQAARVSQDASREMARVKGGKRVRLAFVPLADVIRRRVDSASQAQSGLGATHVVRGRLTALDNGRFVLHAFVTDTRTQANNGDWEFGYAPGELRYAPLALAGMVTATLRLPPLAVPGVNTAAREDYLAGLAYAGRNSTVDKALPLFESAVAADPDSAFTWAALAEAQWMKYFITKDEAWLGRTTESLRHAQSRDLDLAPVHRVTGLLRFNSGFYELAEAEYQRSIELDPANGATYWRLGQAFENNNQLDQALGALRKAVDLEPNNFKMYLELGAFHLKRGDLTEAVRLFETCVRLAPDEPEAHYALGTAYSDQGRWAEAERELRKAIAPGGTASALNNLANVLITQGKDGEVIPFLLSALKQFPDRYRWWMNLGDAYRRTDQPKDSKSAYRRALELAGTEMARNPRDGAVRSGLAYLSARLDDRKRAESEIAQALQSSPGDKDTQLMAAWTYEALGERAQTLTLLANVQDEILAEAARLPNLAELRKDSRFQELLSSHRIQ